MCKGGKGELVMHRTLLCINANCVMASASLCVTIVSLGQEF